MAQCPGKTVETGESSVYGGRLKTEAEGAKVMLPVMFHDELQQQQMITANQCKCGLILDTSDGAGSWS